MGFLFLMDFKKKINFNLCFPFIVSYVMVCQKSTYYFLTLLISFVNLKAQQGFVCIEKKLVILKDKSFSLRKSMITIRQKNCW